MKVTRFTKLRRAAVLAVLAGSLVGPAAYADSGFYLGGSLGDASVEVDDFGFDENDSASKIFGGFIFDMPVVDFAVEAAYVDLGTVHPIPLGCERNLASIWGPAGQRVAGGVESKASLARTVRSHDPDFSGCMATHRQCQSAPIWGPCWTMGFSGSGGER